MILDNAQKKIAHFNSIGLHYNIVSGGIHNKRTVTDPFGVSFLPYIVAGLISYDMARFMGKEKYELNGRGFASRLEEKLREIKPLINPLMKSNLTQIDLRQNHDAIIKAYDILSRKGISGLHSDKGKSFHVGAAKILHFLNPNLFIIIDSNAARAFKSTHDIAFSQGTQPGYSSSKYIKCMDCVKKDILAYGLERFQALEPETPITRIYDKLTFITGAGWEG